MDENLKIKIRKSHTFNSFNKIIQSLSEKNDIENPTVNWFRSIVNKFTSVGHYDISISENLIKVLSQKYTNLYFNTFSCPWLFKSNPSLQQFILKKFGFYLDNESKITNEEVMAKAKTVAGIKIINDHLYSFSWSLGALLIDNHKSDTYKIPKNKILTILILLNIFLIINILFQMSYSLSSSDFYGLSNFIVFALFGSLISEYLNILSNFIRNTRKMNFNFFAR